MNNTSSEPTKKLSKNSYIYASLLLLLGFGLLLLNTVLMQGNGTVYYCGAICISAAPVLFLSKMLRRQGVDWFTIGCFILAAIVSLHHIHISYNLTYTNDLYGHVARIKYTVLHWLSPYGYSGEGIGGYSQIHHPPLYYYMAGMGYWIAEKLALTIDPFTAVRLVSWIAYLCFNFYSLLTLRTIRSTGTPYYAAACLLLLWPLGLHIASKISPEPMYYAVYAAAFYYIILWYQQKTQKLFCMALLLSGLAFTVRTNAFFLFFIIGALLLLEMWRGKFRIEKAFWKKYLGVSMVLILCALFNAGHLLEGKIAFQYYMGDYQGFYFNPRHYLTMDVGYFISRPFKDWSSVPSFMEYLFQTSIFGEYIWPQPVLASAINLCLLAIVFYVLLAWLIATRKAWKSMLPFALNSCVSLAFLLLFSLRVPNMAAQDFRYIHAALACFIIFYMRSMEIYKARGFAFMQPIGVLLTFIFVTLSIVFFWFNIR